MGKRVFLDETWITTSMTGCEVVSREAHVVRLMLLRDQRFSSGSHWPLIKACNGLNAALYAIFRLSLIQ